MTSLSGYQKDFHWQRFSHLEVQPIKTHVSSSLNSEQSDDGAQQVNQETSAAAGWGGAVTTPRKEPVCSAGVWMWMSELIPG